MKRVVAEMGGKDAIIVAEDADLDDAAMGTVQAAFGFQGQKCSACSRLIVDEKVHDELMEKILEHTKKLKIGLPTEGDTNMTAVINQKSFDNATKMIQKGIDEGGKVVIGGKGDDSSGFYIEPTIIDEVEPKFDRRTAGNFRAGFSGYQSQKFRSRAGNRQRYGLRFDGRGLFG